METPLLEKLEPGDKVIKIPFPGDLHAAGDGGFAPYGASAVVLVGEKTMKVENLDSGERYQRYGCIIRYDNEEYASPTLDGDWFRDRKGLLKITPDADLIVKEELERFKEDTQTILSLNEVIELAQKMEGLKK